MDVADGVKAAVTAASKGCLKEIRAKSPRSEGGNETYAKGWRLKKAYDGPYDIRYIIHNKARPGLVHLLENGHAKVNGGRVEGRPHVGPAERNARRELEQSIPEAIENAGKN